MEIILTKKQTVNPAAGFHIHVEYEHGDADLVTHAKFHFKTEAELIEYIKNFEAASKAIEENRRYGKELPKRYKSMVDVQGIELEYDKFSNSSNYYADMGISRIEYVDDAGALYSVEVRK